EGAADGDGNISFGSVIDPNLSDEVRITVIATGFDRSAKLATPPEPPTPTRRPAQVALPYDVSTQTTKEYPAPMPPRGNHKAQAMVIDEPDIHVEYDT